MSLKKEQVRVAVIGAGIAGISTAIALKRQLQFENFIVYEKASDVGGTWRDNTYPGAGSDVGGHWYSLSTDLNPSWATYYLDQPDIQAYWQGLVRKYALESHIVFNTLVTAATWDADAQLYRLVLTDAANGSQRTDYAEIVLSAVGTFMSPTYPIDVPGRGRFRGEAFHSARWRHDVDLRDKRVGVIGNGCSAAQFIPHISSDPAVEVINFCRTPGWFVPRSNFSYPSWVKWAFAKIPLVLRMYRNYLASRHDMNFLMFFKDQNYIASTNQKLMVRYITHEAPKQYLEQLVPSYPPGCKRLIVDPGYLNALKRPNVSLNWDGIDDIIPEGIRTKKGEIVPLDVMIFATGFEHGAINVNVTGSSGKTIQEFFESQDGPTAYLGTTVPGFPNFFIIFGPNTATGHASVICSVESQINYTVQMIKPLLERTAKSFEVATSAFDEYNRNIQQRISRLVYTECASWYNRAGGRTGKNTQSFPGPLLLFWWWTRTPNWEHYKAVGAEKWDLERRRKKLRNIVLGLCMFVLALRMSRKSARSLIWKACFDWQDALRLWRETRSRLWNTL